MDEIRIELATTFIWLGMVLAISFLEAPLKFRAPGVDIPIGLGIARIVFRILNRVEIALALIALAAIAIGRPTGSVAGLTAAILIGRASESADPPMPQAVRALAATCLDHGLAGACTGHSGHWRWAARRRPRFRT